MFTKALPLRAAFSLLFLAPFGLVGCGTSTSGVAEPSSEPRSEAPSKVAPLVLAAIPKRATLLPNMGVERNAHTATLLSNGDVLVVGGEHIGSPRNLVTDVELFEHETRSWKKMPPLPAPRAHHTATLLGDGKVLIVGGGRGNGVGLPSGLEVSTDALLYDPATGAMESIGPNLIPRHYHRAFTLPSGSVLLVGGAGNESTTRSAQGDQNAQPFGNGLSSAEIYEPESRSFRAVGPMREVRYAFGASQLSDGRVLVSGGASYESGEALSSLTAEMYNEKTGMFSAVASMGGRDRLFHSMLRLSDDRVLVFGGKQSNVAFLSDTQIYDAKEDVWSAGKSATPARTGVTTVPTVDGGALIISGLACGGAGCEVPKTVQHWGSDGSVTKVASLKIGRADATATVLLDGTVLVLGGFEASSLASAEILSP